MISLIKDTFCFLDGRVTVVDESDVYFFQRCVQNAVWKHEAEAKAVLEVLINIADHESVSLRDANCIHESLLSSIVTVAKAARKLEYPSE